MAGRRDEHPRSQLVPIAARGLDGALEDIQQDDDDDDDGEKKRSLPPLSAVPSSAGGQTLYTKRALLAFAGLIAIVLVGVAAKSGGSRGGGGKLAPGAATTSLAGGDAGARFRRTPSASSVEAHLRKFTVAPHVAGSAADYATALYTRDTMRSYGLDAHLVEYRVLLTYPLRQGLRAVGADLPPSLARYSPRLREAPVAGDAASASFEHAYPYASPYHGYSANGNVTAPLVYVNFGRQEDFAALEVAGVNVSGCVVLARYGEIFRGNKVMNAQERGAVGALIYSDPQQDGFGAAARQGRQPLPRGPFRPRSGVQRGTVFDGEGDPLTPGRPALPNAAHPGATPRLSIEEARDPAAAAAREFGWHLAAIPSLPLSWGDAAPLLRELGGAAPPDAGWVGGLTAAAGAAAADVVPYRVGPSQAFGVNLLSLNNFSRLTPIWNVVAALPGSAEPDRAVVLGNHRDAWVGGAVDPNSGSSTLLEVARGLGALVEGGWRPRRTLLLCSWDAEEFGMVGSSEWVEENEALLTAQAVAYLNVDEAVSGQGPLRAAASPSLAHAIYAAAAAVPQPPQTLANTSLVRVGDAQPPGETVLDFWSKHHPGPGGGGGGGAAKTPPVGSLGSGSDFSAFLDHLCVPSSDLSFSGDENGHAYYGVYHSLHDSFAWAERFTGFEHHAAMARLWGTLAITLADELVLPYNVSHYAAALGSFAGQSRAQYAKAAKAAKAASVAASATDLDAGFAQLDDAIAEFVGAAAAAMNEAAQLKEAGGGEEEGAAATGQQCGSAKDRALRARRLNDRMMAADRSFCVREGLPRNGWYKNLVYSPDFHNEYYSEKFPSLTEALNARKWGEARVQLDVIANHVRGAATNLKGSGQWQRSGRY